MSTTSGTSNAFYIFTRAVVICDICKARLDLSVCRYGQKRRQEAWAKAKQHGWQWVRRKHTCPQCAPKLSKKPAQPKSP